MNWPKNIWLDIDSNYTYQVINNRDVYVFKFSNNQGALVSKPAGHYQNKINIWELTPIVLINNQWTVDINKSIIFDLVEVDIPPMLIQLRNS